MLFEENVNIFAWIILFIVFGGFFYLLDRWFGVSIYRWFYNMTHKDPMPENVVKGFLHNQKAKIRCANACVLALFLSLINYYSDEKANPLYAFLNWIMQVPLVFIGFCLGPILFKLWGKKDKLFQTVDKIESGEIGVSDKIKNAAQSVAKDIAKKASETVNEALSSIKNQNEDVKEEKEEKIGEVEHKDDAQNNYEEKKEEGKQKDINEDVDPKELMNKYLRK